MKVEHPYTIDPDYSKPVAYFCMEYAIHQPLKLYAGGLGFLAGSHLRSAYQLRQNMVAVGILWKYGYYDQVRRSDQTMDVLFQEKVYGFLKPTGIKFSIMVSGQPVWVTAYYLPCNVFNTVPLFLLSTDLPENDYLAKTICHRLYDPNPETKIASAILLGIGGCRLLEELKWSPEVYHLNESHALPLGFFLYNKYKDVNEVKKRLVFTNHTIEEGGNQKFELWLLERMGFFCNVPVTEVRALTNTTGHELNLSLGVMKLSGIANGVSVKHSEILSSAWKKHDVCPIISITNAQNFNYWANMDMYEALKSEVPEDIMRYKLAGKEQLFEWVADQNGEILDKNILTLVFAKRFTGYKRPDLLLHDMDRFHSLMSDSNRPIQIIWAGKPYPADYASIGIFDKIVNVCKKYNNCSVLAGYEMRQSKMLKNGSDVWLNNPRIGHEASGTSGMTAAMNGSINLSIADGWFPEFAKDKVNSFVIPHADSHLTDHEQDLLDANNLYEILEKEVLPMYYDYPDRWLSIIKTSMTDIMPYFDSDRLARDYYKLVYKGVG
ncbi:MAG: alpha-glucan family phosphorylase [Chitinophagaceae bacterium]|nr:alpha-glucan family phosphorylase [Chitinophagaceae bacterium]